ncbi:Na+/H+ antiporter subunit A [Streptomyces sp. AJS327]|uniref:Na+/H+ antiporter subunit A n=1 Tax=Streptomyces sp. AJS327 TaxID=2545265 RepID=UPI0015DE1DF8|nr:Na+/H+ antiporter subunit A [Streptomyces sp. AJS327]MBA0050381.1 Na+/H+ antiporter subunit A [Streptomyces sp. AJS327]
MLWLIVLHCVAACCAQPLVRWLGPRAFVVLALVPASAAVWAGTQWSAVAAGEASVQTWAWIPDMGVNLALRCDPLALLMTLIAGGVGALVMLYCAAYFPDDEPRLARFAGTLTAFTGAMLGLVLADDLIVLYVLWELTTVFSFLLIGHNPERRTNRRAALQALIVTTLGGLVMFVGFLMLGQAAGTYRISAIVADPPSASPTISVALVLTLVGALSKSAVWPFSFWLPGAMAAPTPVSAYLHAAAMVKAGVYLVARLAPAFADVVPWRATVLVLGGATMLLGGWRALRETDLKRLLAFGTVSQLGFLTLLVGEGGRNTALAGVTMILAHALFKAPLFLTVGVIDKTTGTRELNRLSGLARSQPVLCVAAVLAGLSMAGLPPLLGFAAKEAAVDALLHGDSARGWALVVVVAGSALTTAYTLRFLWGAFARKPGVEDTPLRARAGVLLLAPLVTCALTGLLLGPGVTWLDPLLGRFADTFVSVTGDEKPFHLALWHGFGPALGISAISWLAGAVLFLLARPLAGLGEWMASVDGDRAFARSLWALERVSLQATGAVQRGSLPLYLGTALLVLIGTQAVAIFVDRPWEHLAAPRIYDALPQLAVAIGVCLVAVLCVRAQQRMKAVVLAGVTGYGTAVLYVLHGAPDLALTQFAVETVSVIVFVLVLRRLPARFPDRPVSGRRRRITQLVFGIAAGTFAAGLTYLAASARMAEPAGPHLTATTEHDGVKNVVATTLVDLRAWDTMGESAVLAVAAVGVTSLVYLRRRSGSPGSPVSTAASVSRLGAPGTLAPTGPEPPAGGTAAPAWPGGSLRPIAGERVAAPRGREGTGQEVPGIWKVAGVRRGGARPTRGSTIAPRRTWLAASSTLAPERRSVIFEVLARLIFHPIIVLSLYLLFCAENLPGGGFAAGLVAGLALTVRYLAGGRHELAAALPADAGFLLGLGLLIMTLTGIGGLVLGDSVLQSGKVTGELPLIGPFHAASPVLFDTGIYLLVLGVVLDVLRSLGSEVDRRVERELLRQHRQRTESPVPAGLGEGAAASSANGTGGAHREDAPAEGPPAEPGGGFRENGPPERGTPGTSRPPNTPGPSGTSETSGASGDEGPDSGRPDDGDGPRGREGGAR